MAKKTKAERTAEFVGMLAAGIMDAALKPDPRTATKQSVIDALRKHYGRHGTTVVKDLVSHVAKTYLTLPFAARLIMHDIVEEAILEWLPERSVMRTVATGAFPILTATIESLLAKPTITEDEIVHAMLPTFTNQFNAITGTGGPVADPHHHPDPHHPAAAAPTVTTGTPNYIDKRAKLEESVRNIIDRLLHIAEIGSRMGKDPNPEVEGVAAMLRTAIMEEVSLAETESVNTLIAPWGDELIAQLLAADNTAFLGNERVQRLISTFIGTYHERHPGTVSAKTADAMDAFLEGSGVPSALREAMKKLLKLENMETVADVVENTVYPGILWSFRVAFALPIGVAAMVLGAVAVLTLGVQTFVLNEYEIARDTLSGFEFARRAIGFALNAAYQLTVPGMYLLVALLVGGPFLGARRLPDGTWTWGKPTKPTDPLPGSEPPGVTLEEHKANQLSAYENDADEWRRVYRRSLFMRGMLIPFTLIVGTILVVLAGLVVSIPTYQHLTLIEFVVIAVIGFHILWLGDDLANKVRETTTPTTEEHHAEGADGAHADAHGKEKHEKRITRIRKISATMTLIVAAAAFTYFVAIHLAPWAWAVGTLLPVYLLLALSVFIVSRILFGDSSDAPHDVQEDSGKQRRFVHKVVAGTLGFGGAALFVTSMALSVAVHGFGWYQSCKGYEGTYECSWASEDGYAQYVDSPDRWEALRDNSAKALRTRKKPTGDSCVIATKEVSRIEAAYRTSVLSGPDVVTDNDGVCESLASDVELRKRFPKWAKTCAVQHVVCEKG